MTISVSNIIAFAKRRRRTTFAIGAALVTTLSFGAAEMVAQMKNAEFDANIASPASAQTLPAPIAGMALSEFLAATRATRFLPSERTWWSRKGDAKPKAFAAIADPMEDPAGEGLPEGVKPVAFSALAPTGGPVGGGDDPIIGQSTPGAGPSPFAPPAAPSPGGPFLGELAKTQ